MIGYKSRENSAFVVLELLSWDPKIKIHVEKTLCSNQKSTLVFSGGNIQKS